MANEWVVEGTVTSIDDDLGPCYWVNVLGKDGKSYCIHGEVFACADRQGKLEDLIGKQIRFKVSAILEIL